MKKTTAASKAIFTVMASKPRKSPNMGKRIVAKSLKSTMLEAIMFRLRRNYVWLFAVVLVTWLTKLFTHPAPAQSLLELYSRTEFGLVPAWLATSIVLVFYSIVFISLFTRFGKSAAADEIHGLERVMGQWKV